MKHQALARVFAVVLAILCLLLLATGVRGFGKADEALNERRAWEEKYAGRIQSYVELEEELAGSISYEEAQRELEKRLEQHESDASQHRTDTALHTAEKGGNQMGADMIWEAMPELASAKGDLEEAKKELAEKEAAFAQGKAAITAQVNSGVAACSAEKAALPGLVGALTEYLTDNPVPTLPPMPQLPAAPIVVEDPGEFTETEPDRAAFVTAIPPAEPVGPPAEPGEDADEAEREAYEQELAAYQQALADYQTALAAYQEELSQQEAAYAEALAAYQARKAAHDFQRECFLSLPERMKEYQEALAAYERDMQAYAAAAAELQDWQKGYLRILGPYVEDIGSLAYGLSEAGASLAALAAELGGEGGSAGGMGGWGMPTAEQLIGQPPAAIAAALSGAVDGMLAGYGQISAGLGAIEGGLAEARNKVFEGELALKKAEAEMQGQLETIWYNLGELEKEAEELAEEKKTLDQEASVLSKKILENEALKDLTNRRNSARQLLLNVAEVKSESAESGDLPGAAERYLERCRSETQALDEGRRRVNVLAILAAAAGLLGIPGAFELTKKRVLLLVPVLLCLGFAAGADWLHASLGFGQMYTALFTAIFAAIQFLIVLPKKNTIA